MADNKKYIGIVIVSALLLAGSIGLNINALGVFVKPVSSDLNILVGEFSIHSTLLSIGIALASFTIPNIVRKYSFKAIIIVATSLLALSTLGMSFSNATWQFSILGFIRGFASAFYGIVPLQLLINNWFVSKHGVVTSIVLSSSGIAGALFSPILAQVIENQGWQFAYLVQAIIFVLLSLPAILFPFKFDPIEEGLEPYRDASESLKEDDTLSLGHGRSKLDMTFGILMLSSILITALTGFAQHLSAVGEDVGYSASVGALMISACMIGNIVFKLLIGVISDSKGAGVATSVMVTITLLGFVLIYLGHSQLFMIIGSFLFGAVYSITSVGLTLLTKKIYSPEVFVKAFPMLNFLSNMGAAFAVSLYGFSYDFSATYSPSMIISFLACVIVIINVFFIQRNNKEYLEN